MTFLWRLFDFSARPLVVLIFIFIFSVKILNFFRICISFDNLIEI